MHIARVQIEEGFLDGLDVSFVPGLNVIIGERGTGKTSLIELVRFCLGVRGYTSDSERRSRDHALSILGSGQVIVTMSDGEREVTVTRTASDESPRKTSPYPRPIVFSQTEIETVGLRAQARLRLLDGFVGTQADSNPQEANSVAEVRSLTAEMKTLRHEINQLEGQINEIPELEKQIAELSPREQQLAKVSEEASKKKQQLDDISTNINASAVSVDAIGRFHNSISNWVSSLSSISCAPPKLEPWPRNSGNDPLVDGRASVERAKTHLEAAKQELNRAMMDAEQQLKSFQKNKLDSEDHARHLRKEVEKLQAGAGEIVRQGQQLRQRRAQLMSLETVLGERKKALTVLARRRERSLDQLESVRVDRFNSRNAAANQLTKTLGPRIQVGVSRAGQFEGYSAAIADALRGSGLRYNELSTTLSSNVSPRELLEAIDSHDIEFITEATGITRDRAARALAQLGECDLGTLATVAVDDTVDFQLLDGVDYKGISELSTGQRCTVVLPLILRHIDRILIVDQPEDHIDNAFITETLIVSILARGVDSQIIFSTHNANIPVLGNADRVVHLASDGRRGFCRLNSSLDNEDIVSAISTVMEGGEEAFKQRATFYQRYGLS